MRSNTALHVLRCDAMHGVDVSELHRSVSRSRPSGQARSSDVCFLVHACAGLSLSLSLSLARARARASSLSSALALSLTHPFFLSLSLSLGLARARSLSLCRYLERTVRYRPWLLKDDSRVSPLHDPESGLILSLPLSLSLSLSLSLCVEGGAGSSLVVREGQTSRVRRCMLNARALVSELVRMCRRVRSVRAHTHACARSEDV